MRESALSATCCGPRPPAVAIAAASGYTRQPDAFNDGWRARFWAEGFDGSANNILMQGSGVARGSLGGIGWAPTSTFASHLWTFNGYGSYRRFVLEMTCVRQAGCDRAGFSATDANTLVLSLNDVEPSRIALTNPSIGETTITYRKSQPPLLPLATEAYFLVELLDQTRESRRRAAQPPSTTSAFRNSH